MLFQLAAWQRLQPYNSARLSLRISPLKRIPSKLKLQKSRQPEDGNQDIFKNTIFCLLVAIPNGATQK